MILNVYMCKQFHYEINQLYNKVIMHDLFFNVFIYFVITSYIIMWGGGQMAKVLGCD